MRVDQAKIKACQDKILAFYEEQGRHGLPWRKTTDRYAILVSEVMLQQTQVERVIPKYEAWLEAFPTPSALAAAPLADVLRLWSGLGYNSRAKRLHDAAKTIMERHRGKVPSTVKELLELPGIGPYTARSTLIFADNEDLATVDTNIRRILIHELGLREDLPEKELFTLAQEILPRGRSREWHNALMDYGAIILTARRSGIRPTSKQSPFKGSKRSVRGAIMRRLATGGELRPSQLRELMAGTRHDPVAVAEDLVREGLLRKEGEAYKLG